MQNTKKSESRKMLAFERKIEDKPGGITVAITDLTQKEIPAGTPVGMDNNGLFHVIKNAVLHANAANNAVAYQVKKGHNLKVGDFITNEEGAVSEAITAINTDNANYDVITVGTTLGVALTAGDIIFQSAAQSADASALKYEPYGLTGTSLDVIEGDNHATDCVVRGTAIVKNIPAIHADIRAKLPLIRFV